MISDAIKTTKLYNSLQVKSYESINSLSSERKRSGGAATPRSIDEEAISMTPDLGEGTDADKSAPISLESIPAVLPGSEEEPYYDQVPVDINDGEYVYIQAGKGFFIYLSECKIVLI